MIERVQGEDRPDLPIIVGLHFMGADAETTDKALFNGLDGAYRFVLPVGQHEVDGYTSWFPEGYYHPVVSIAGARRLADAIGATLIEYPGCWPRCP